MLQKDYLKDLIKNIPGETRGVVLQTDKEYVLLKEGKEGFEKLKKRVKELDLPLEYEKAKALEWIPMGQRIVSLLVIKDTFGWTDKELREMGKSAPKISFIVKFFFRLFLSPTKIAKEVPKYWREHFTEGKLWAREINEKENYFILRLEYPVKLPPIMYIYWEGYFEGTMALTRKGGKAKVKMIEKPDLLHPEYYVTWE